MPEVSAVPPPNVSTSYKTNAPTASARGARTSNEPTSADLLVANGFLTKQQAAAELGITVRSLNRLYVEKRQGPPFIRIGRKTWYRRESLVAWVASLEKTPGRPTRNRR